MFGGWVVGLFFSDVVLGGLHKLGVNTGDLQLWQIGAVLGFVGGFIRPSTIERKTN